MDSYDQDYEYDSNEYTSDSEESEGDYVFDIDEAEQPKNSNNQVSKNVEEKINTNTEMEKLQQKPIPLLQNYKYSKGSNDYSLDEYRLNPIQLHDLIKQSIEKNAGYHFSTTLIKILSSKEFFRNPNYLTHKELQDFFVEIINEIVEKYDSEIANIVTEEIKNLFNSIQKCIATSNLSLAQILVKKYGYDDGSLEEIIPDVEEKDKLLLYLKTLMLKFFIQPLMKILRKSTKPVEKMKNKKESNDNWGYLLTCQYYHSVVMFIEVVHRVIFERTNELGSKEKEISAFASALRNAKVKGLMVSVDYGYEKLEKIKQYLLGQYDGDEIPIYNRNVIAQKFNNGIHETMKEIMSLSKTETSVRGDEQFCVNVDEIACLENILFDIYKIEHSGIGFDGIFLTVYKIALRILNSGNISQFLNCEIIGNGKERGLEADSYVDFQINPVNLNQLLKLENENICNNINSSYQVKKKVEICLADMMEHRRDEVFLSFFNEAGDNIEGLKKLTRMMYDASAILICPNNERDNFDGITSRSMVHYPVFERVIIELMEFFLSKSENKNNEEIENHDEVEMLCEQLIELDALNELAEAFVLKNIRYGDEDINTSPKRIRRYSELQMKLDIMDNSKLPMFILNVANYNFPIFPYNISKEGKQLQILTSVSLVGKNNTFEDVPSKSLITVKKDEKIVIILLNELNKTIKKRVRCLENQVSAVCKANFDTNEFIKLISRKFPNLINSSEDFIEHDNCKLYYILESYIQVIGSNHLNSKGKVSKSLGYARKFIEYHKNIINVFVKIISLLETILRGICMYQNIQFDSNCFEHYVEELGEIISFSSCSHFKKIQEDILSIENIGDAINIDNSYKNNDTNDNVSEQIIYNSLLEKINDSDTCRNNVASSELPDKTDLHDEMIELFS